MKNVELDKIDITNEIKNEFVKNAWKGIGTKRICPKCNAPISYKNKWSFIYAEKDNKICKICNAKLNAEKCKKLFKGEGNPFYGKKHSMKSKKKMKSTNRSYMMGDNNPMKSEKCKKYFSKLFSGEKNPMFGKHHTKSSLNKISKKLAGKNNPMYGKPSPQGSGNGWASWYKGFHFRSLRELQYFIDEIDEKAIIFESAQGKNFRIPYKNYDGKDRSYQPDFLINKKILIEIKPKKLWNTLLVKLKKKAAEKFCQENNLEYRLIDINPNSKLLKEKYLNGEIKFVDKYKERFEKYAGIK